MKNLLSVAILATLGLAHPAHAEVRVSGFGQIVAGTLVGEDDYFPERGYDEDIDLAEESLVAVQVDADVTERISATAQVVATAEDGVDAELAWAYVNANLGHGFAAKVGRQRIPFYRYSDFLDVGYAYPWIRPPVAMYNQPWSNADGVGLSHSGYYGNWFSQVQAFYGDFSGEIEFAERYMDAELEGIRAFSWDVEYNEWLSLRAAYVDADVTVIGSPLDPLTDMLRAYRQGGLASRLDYRNDHGTFKSLGFRVDRANWLVVGEYSQLNIEDSVFDNIDRTDWYATVAHRFGNVMPHVTYGRRSAGADTGPLRGIPTASPLYGPVAYALNSQRLDETFTSVGVRWDFAPKLALKADWTYYDDHLPGGVDGGLASAALVFTF